MNSPRRHISQFLILLLCAVGLASCGGGGPDNTQPAMQAGAIQDPATSATPVRAQHMDRSSQIAALRPPAQQAVASPSIIVRAHGTLAGNIGPQMQVRINGVVVADIEVRETSPSDYVFQTAALRVGDKVDVAFTNDAVVNGVNRDLFVASVRTSDTIVVPTAPGVTYDRGIGAAAFDGLDVIAGRGDLGWAGALRMSWPAPNLTDRLTVRASGTIAGGVGPLMQVRVDGVVVAATEVRAQEPADHVLPVPALRDGSRVDIVYVNDAVVSGVDRNLTVAYALAGTTYVLPTWTNVTYDVGSGNAAFDGANVIAGQTQLGSNGALRFRWPAPNMTASLVVRAQGVVAGDQGPMMEVRVDNVVVGRTEVRSGFLEDFAFPSPTLSPGSKVDVAYTNPGVVGTVTRSLMVAYATSGTTFVRATDAAVVFDRGTGASAFDGANVSSGRSDLSVAGALRMVWPVPNMTDRIVVNARGDIAGNVGPRMQVQVDGIVVGTAEVRSTAFLDYAFATAPLAAGSKVDVVYLNDATIDGVDRNLHVANVVSGTTFMLPTSAGVTYDRGSGAGAFDGVDVVTGQSALGWAGALRMTWPSPNITGLLTVRASGTVAGGVGPIMQVRVDGVAVSSAEVKETAPTDYQMPVPPLRTGSRLDIVYTNDEVVSGVDRNLVIAYATSGSTFAVPTDAGVTYDLGSGAAAFDGQDVVSGRNTLGSNGALRFAWPAPNVTDTITVRASASLASNVGAVMQVRVDGVIAGAVEVRSTTPADYVFSVPRIAAGKKVDVVFTNDFSANGQDRNLYVHYVTTSLGVLVPSAPYAVVDSGTGEAAFDGAGTAAGSALLSTNGALRLTVPQPPAADPALNTKYAASRFLQQASFGPTAADINRVAQIGQSAWITEQMALPVRSGYVDFVQRKYDLGPDYRPGGNRYTNTWVGQRFWANAATSPDQLRQRTVWALHKIFMVSQQDSNLWLHSRAYANYLDTLNVHAFGNFRTLLDEIARSPAMGIYLSHMRNRKEDPATGRLPDENFAREVMQLFTIGLHELNANGTPRTDGSGNPIETYNNNDVMAMARVFTGWGWAFPDNQLTEQNFRWGNPDYSVAGDQRIDLLPMKPYPDQHSVAEKRLFSGKSNALVIPAGTSAQESLRLALDALFRHPNVGPFIGRQLIQHFVTSNPSPAYVARVAAVFNNNGAGVRGDLAAVVRAVLLDTEARTAPSGDVGKLREPVIRVTHWMRSFEAASLSGEYMMSGELDSVQQRAVNAPSVFGYFRPGYVPPNTVFSASATTVPELQIVSESTTAYWVNIAQAMAGNGLGWTGSTQDVSSSLRSLTSLSSAGNVDGMIQQLNLLLFAGRMSPALRQEILDSITSIYATDSASHLSRARVALFLSFASPEYLLQR